jgi:mannose-6-phosphate isomerase-like protein (cupin superfamily)
MGHPVPVTYLGEGEPNASLLPGTQQQVIKVASMTATVLATAELTGGRYSAYRLDLAPEGGGAAPHFHRTFAESFHVLSGAVELFDGGAWVDAGPGDHLVIPEGGVHGFRNVRPEPASLLMLSVPGAPREDYFAEIAEIAAEGVQLTEQQWAELYARHDQYMV